LEVQRNKDAAKTHSGVDHGAAHVPMQMGGVGC
jgi:hypothetical protein